MKLFSSSVMPKPTEGGIPAFTKSGRWAAVVLRRTSSLLSESSAESEAGPNRGVWISALTLNSSSSRGSTVSLGPDVPDVTVLVLWT